MKSRSTVIVGTLLIVVSVFLFSYNLLWGAPYFFHPDERNIAYSVSGLMFPSQLNPHFFAYGSLPIYTIYLLSLFTTLPHVSFTVSLGQAILASRLLSDFLTVGTVLLLFLAGRKLANTKTGLFASFLGIFSIGFIQFAHFGTFEMWLTFFYLLLFYRFLFFLASKTIKQFFYLLIITGILIAIKISSLVLLFIPFLAAVMLLYEKKQNRAQLLLKIVLLSLVTIGSIFLLTNPYAFLDVSSFISSIQYESSVATGALPVFYTGGFVKTMPIFYQLLHVYPFLLNPIVLLIGIVSLAVLMVKKQLPFSSRSILLFFFLYFLSQVFLFVKWTRYLMPTLPFFYLAIALVSTKIYKATTHSQLRHILAYGVILLCVASSLLWSSSYFITVFVQKDTRLAALDWAEKHLPPSSHILTESYDLGTLPFQTYFPNTTAFNFYDLGTNPQAKTELSHLLITSDILLLPSQRVIKNRLSHPDVFPIGNRFYTEVLTGKHFKKVYETPCDIFCRITYLNSPVFSFEETASVFDRPTIQIYEIHEK